MRLAIWQHCAVTQNLFHQDRLSTKAQKKGHSRETRHCRQMDASSWQCPMSHCPLSHRIFDLKRPPIHLTLWLFPKLKNVLKGLHFGTLVNIQKSVTDMLKTIPVEDFQSCYQKVGTMSPSVCSCPRELFWRG